MPLWGGLRIGVDKSEPKIPPLVIVNVPPGRSSTAIVPSRALAAKPAIAFSIAANESRSASRMTGTIRPALGADGHADVEVIVEDDLVAVDPAVDGGKRLQGFDRRLDEERHEAQRDPVLLLKRLLVLGAQVHHPRHVGFVEGRQDRGGLLGLDQALGDLLAEAAHALAGFADRPDLAGSAAGPGPARRLGPARGRRGSALAVRGDSR